MGYMKGRRLNRIFREYTILLVLCATGWVSSSEEEMHQLNTERFMFYHICEAIRRYK